MVAHTPFVVRRAGYRLRCGKDGCSAIVGRIRWDEAGWPHIRLEHEACPRCHARQLLDPASLDAETAARYRFGNRAGSPETPRSEP